MTTEAFTKNTWPCPGKPEDLKGQPIGMSHCDFCGEMQIAGMDHLAPQFPSQWEEPFPKVPEQPDYGPDDEEQHQEHHQQHHQQLAEDPPSTACPVCGARSVTFTREEEHFPYGAAPHTVMLRAVVEKGHCTTCMFELTDWRAEIARSEAVKHHLSTSKESP